MWAGDTRGHPSHHAQYESILAPLHPQVGLEGLGVKVGFLRVDQGGPAFGPVELRAFGSLLAATEHTRE
jgi:hypothetical protein